MPAGGVSHSAFNVAEDMSPLSAESHPFEGPRQSIHARTAQCQTLHRSVAHVEEDDGTASTPSLYYPLAEQGDEADEAAEQGGAAGGEQGGEA